MVYGLPTHSNTQVWGMASSGSSDYQSNVLRIVYIGAAQLYIRILLNIVAQHFLWRAQSIIDQLINLF